ncbi:N-acetylmuramic acid 6-phosphate etherase [Microbacterium lacticum]|uniref:N-acetylmuramic acid 6-phosphate etherase n=1 Tax=Microbacterium lacticum TaxID=33885 RepID=UPI0028D90640|nr:N-acetylmuramic acid 6-phosphate etherase [Microbacterium lacticum]
MPTPTDSFAISPTETRSTSSLHLDELSSLEIVQLLNAEDATVAAAVRPVLPALASLVDRAVTAVSRGGRIHYFGAGTSGRLAVLDAAELLPTFNLAPGIVEAHIAGGDVALRHAVEGSEDSRSAGRSAAGDVSAGDVAIGIAASGNTPYVRAALAEAQERGAFTALLCANPYAGTENVDELIVADSGPEVLTGSTRLKAGTAAKLMLNGFSTALMVRLGYSWSNLMVNVVATNAKLRARSVRIFADVSGLDSAAAETALANASGDLKTALVMHLTGAHRDDAQAALTSARGVVRTAAESLTAQQTHHRATSAD